MKETRILQTISEWENIKQEIPRCGLIIFKFSTTCPISWGVQRDFEAWRAQLAEEPEFLCVKVDVRASRKLSQHLAKELGVQHESPQAIWMSPEHNVFWHASHHSISKTTLDIQLRKIIENSSL